MSHFSVLVPASDEEHLRQLLIPYKEYGCGEEDDGLEPYLEFEIEVPRDEFEARATKLTEDAEEKGYECAQEYRQLLHEGSYVTIFERYYGGMFGDSDWGYWRNPNQKWDWYSIGGRWSGLLKLKDFATSLVNEAHGRGRPGVFGRLNDNVDQADYAFADNVDWDGMAEERLSNAVQKWEWFQEAKAKAVKTMERDKVPNETLIKAKERHEAPGGERWSLDELVEYFLISDTVSGEHNWFLWGDESEKYDLLYEEFIAAQKAQALTYAFIDLEGNWNQRGQMGWWGMDDKKQGTPDYDEAFWKFVRTIPANQRVYVVDCHI